MPTKSPYEVEMNADYRNYDGSRIDLEKFPLWLLEQELELYQKQDDEEGDIPLFTIIDHNDIFEYYRPDTLTRKEFIEYLYMIKKMEGDHYDF